MTSYENFIQKNPCGTFFQSWVFGKFQETLPYRGKSWALEALDPQKQIVASCLVIKQKLPLGLCWLWIPYGPIGFDERIFEDIERIAKEERAVFARFEPPVDWKWTDDVKKSWLFAYSRKRYTPEHSLILNLNKSEDEILAQMKPKGRYNIHVAQKHGVVVENLNKGIDQFYEILKKTGERDSFGVHPKSFYENLLKTFGEQAALFLAYHKEKVIGGIIVIYYKDTATYYYGASDYAHRNLMTPYLLQWEAILDAKRRGMKFYDFLGIAPSDDKNHPLVGVTDFKKKFGGREIIYPRAFDIIYKKAQYKIWRLLKGR